MERISVTGLPKRLTMRKAAGIRPALKFELVRALKLENTRTMSTIAVATSATMKHTTGSWLFLSSAAQKATANSTK